VTTLKEVLAMTATLWPSPPWPESVQVLWAQSLADVEPDLLSAAVQRFYQTDPHGFRPTPGKIRALIQAPTIEGAERGWQVFLRAVEHYAGRSTAETVDMPQFADANVALTVTALGGFRQYLGGIQADQRDWLHSKFLKAYKRVACGEDEPLQIQGGRVPALDGRGPAPEALRDLLGG
jgi:hypothetical protein